MTIDRDELRRRIAEVYLYFDVSADLRVWERHWPEQWNPYNDRPSREQTRCYHDHEDWPCPDFVDLASRYGLTP